MKKERVTVSSQVNPLREIALAMRATPADHPEHEKIQEEAERLLAASQRAASCPPLER